MRPTLVCRFEASYRVWCPSKTLHCVVCHHPITSANFRSRFELLHRAQHLHRALRTPRPSAKQTTYPGHRARTNSARRGVARPACCSCGWASFTRLHPPPSSPILQLPAVIQWACAPRPPGMRTRWWYLWSQRMRNRQVPHLRLPHQSLHLLPRRCLPKLQRRSPPPCRGRRTGATNREHLMSPGET